MPSVSVGSSVSFQCWNRYMSPKVTRTPCMVMMPEVDIAGAGMLSPLCTSSVTPMMSSCRSVARRMTHQRIAQRQVADGALRAGVDDGLGAHAADAHVRDQQPPLTSRSGTTVKSRRARSPCERVISSRSRLKSA